MKVVSNFFTGLVILIAGFGIILNSVWNSEEKLSKKMEGLESKMEILESKMDSVSQRQSIQTSSVSK